MSQEWAVLTLLWVQKNPAGPRFASRMETQSEVEKKIKTEVYKTKEKQENSDTWDNFKVVVDKEEKGAGVCELSGELLIDCSFIYARDRWCSEAVCFLLRVVIQQFP